MGGGTKPAPTGINDLSIAEFEPSIIQFRWLDSVSFGEISIFQLPILSYAICYLLQNGQKNYLLDPIGTCLPLTSCWPRALPCLSFAGITACCRDLGKRGKCGLSPPPMSLKFRFPRCQWFLQRLISWRQKPSKIWKPRRFHCLDTENIYFTGETPPFFFPNQVCYHPSNQPRKSMYSIASCPVIWEGLKMWPSLKFIAFALEFTIRIKNKLCWPKIHHPKIWNYLKMGKSSLFCPFCLRQETSGASHALAPVSRPLSLQVAPPR